MQSSPGSRTSSTRSRRSSQRSRRAPASAHHENGVANPAPKRTVAKPNPAPKRTTSAAKPAPKKRTMAAAKPAPNEEDGRQAQGDDPQEDIPPDSLAQDLQRCAEKDLPPEQGRAAEANSGRSCRDLAFVEAGSVKSASGRPCAAWLLSGGSVFPRIRPTEAASKSSASTSLHHIRHLEQSVFTLASHEHTAYRPDSRTVD
jgi:hypothetical protein